MAVAVLQHPLSASTSAATYMRMQMPPPSALAGAGVEPVVYAPKALPAFRSIDEEDAAAHLPHPPASSTAAGFQHQPWSESTPVEADAKSPRQPKRDVFVCPEVHCGKQFPRSFALRRHMRIHTGTKPYACDYQGCAQRFNTSGNLSRHKRIHSGERPYPCCFETCGKRFNTSTKLKRHMRIHFPDGQNLFRCTEQACSWACDNYKEYVQHQKLHSSVADGFSHAADENVNMNASNGNGYDNHLDRRSLKTLDASRVMPSPMGLMQPDAEPRHVEFPQPNAMHDDFYQQDRIRMYAGVSSMMQKEPQREENDYRRVAGPVLAAKSFMDDRPRLPFPTRAFPSETMGMPSSGLLGSSFHPLTHLPPTSSHRYYDSATPVSSVEMATSSSPSYTSVGSYASAQVPYSSYLRGGETNVLVSLYQPTSTTTSFMATAEPYSQPMRQEDLDSQYESSSPHDTRQHESPPPQQTQTQAAYGGNPAEFTGEELSAVLELMKDS